MRTPDFIPPQIPTLTDDPPSGEGWIHELKHDGYRTLVTLDRGEARAFTRRGHDWTHRYRSIVEAVAKLPCEAAVLDGEVIVQDAAGVADFNALQNALAGAPGRLLYVVFDLLHLNG